MKLPQRPPLLRLGNANPKNPMMIVREIARRRNHARVYSATEVEIMDAWIALKHARLCSLRAGDVLEIVAGYLKISKGGA